MSGIIGLTGIIWGIYFVASHPAEGAFTSYIDIPAFVLLGVLPPCIMLLSHQLSDFFTGIKILLLAMFNRTKTQQKNVINALTTCSAKVRAEGVGTLVNERRKISYDLLIDGISLIINNFTLDEIRHNLNAKISTRQSDMALASNLFENMGKLSPGVGMIGTLLGLVGMMSKLNEPEKIGGSMALALLTTLYGLLLGNVVYSPFGEKISIESEKILALDLLVLEGVLALKDKKSSVHLQDIMKTYSKAKDVKADGKSDPQKQGKIGQ